jgi:DnaJ-class molecular chaperone
MSKFPGKMPDSLARLLVVFAVLTAVLAITWVLIPRPMKDVKVQWAEAVAREKARPLQYAGFRTCEECHGEIHNKKKAGYHRDLACETCHGPAKAHSEDPDKVKPAIPAARSFCPQCHAYNPSRPRGFPQINPQAHNPLKACASCHNPHDPKPPTTPKECSACHGEIARTMAVSHHVQLECTVCHEAPQQHKIAPRSAKPSKPQNREFCGKCHGKDARESKDKLAKNAPKIDIDEHGEKYVCWQCHYPHSPEVEQ